MAMNFGKANRSVAFNPTSAFPLDARTYFESYDEAVAAAAKAQEAGSTDSVYYYGQTLVVVENQIATLYIIQPDNTLALVQGEPAEEFELVVDNNTFVIDQSTGKLSLKNFADAASGTVATKEADGTLVWKTPIDAYTKKETDEKIAAATHLKRKIVGSVAEIETYMMNNADAEQYIYMVPADEAYDNDKYDEYMVVIVADTKVVEKVGSWEVNLEDYAKKTDLDSKVDKIENSRLLTNEEGTKLAGIASGAEVNVIQSVSSDFEIVSNAEQGIDRQLNLKPVSIGKVSGLQDALKGKVDTKEGWTLLSPTDQEKLAKLTFGDTGNLEISGKVNAENVQGLGDWITINGATYISGLAENNLSVELKDKINYITTIDTNNFTVTNGKLELNKIQQAQVEGLTTALGNKVEQTDFSALSGTVSTLQETINGLNSVYVNQTTFTTTVSDLSDRLDGHDTTLLKLEEALTWHDLT